MTNINNTPAPQPEDWLNAEFIRVPINTPQPLHIEFKDEQVMIRKQDVPIIKFHIDDVDAIYAAARLLTGMVRAGIIFAEMEHLKDLLCEFSREANGS
jgi:hypothetical protein